MDSRHLLLTCLVGSGLLGGGPELGIPDTRSKFILGRGNAAVRALRECGVDPLMFLNSVRRRPSLSTTPKEHSFPGFFIFWQQPDRTRILRLEEVGEFRHRHHATSLVYPATLGLLDQSLGKSIHPLLEFEDLLADERTPEQKFQKFFEAYPEFLLTDDHIAVRPGVMLSPGPLDSSCLELKPDFFLQRRDVPLWDIAELKLPFEKLVQGRPARRGLAAAVRWALDQLRTYREYFLDNTLAALFREKYNIEVYHPRLTLIIGRDAAFGTYYERQRLAPPEARLLTYDDLLRFAKHRSLILPFVEAMTERDPC